MSLIEHETIASDRAFAEPGTFTPEDLLGWRGDGVFELINGHVVEKPMGNESGLITATMSRLFIDALQLPGHGYVFSEGWLKCFVDVNLVRRPDIVFAAAHHFVADRPIPDMFRFAPELVVEVTSPNNRSDEIERKVGEYLDAGIPLVWVAHPPRKIIRVHKPGDVVRQYGLKDTIDAEPQLPGMFLRVAEIFAR